LARHPAGATLGCMTDNDRIAKLQAQIDRLEAKQTELYEQLAEARLDQWKGRLEDLEVQVHLGAMDTNERMKALVEKARERWNEAKVKLGGATSVASDVGETVRKGFESAIEDVRKALLDAKAQAKQ
jgi:prefoldin subunit 5